MEIIDNGIAESPYMEEEAIPDKPKENLKKTCNTDKTNQSTGENDNEHS